MRRLVLSVGLAAVLGLTGCGGGGDKDKAAAPPTTTVAPVTTVPIGNDRAGTPFCQLARTYTEKFAALLPSANDPVKLKAATTDAEAAIRQAQATAPPEVKGDVAIVAATAKDALAALQKNNFDLSRTPEAVTKLQEPRFETAFSNLNAYARAHCGVA
jgi:hypothetical protein